MGQVELEEAVRRDQRQFAPKAEARDLLEGKGVIKGIIEVLINDIDLWVPIKRVGLELERIVAAQVVQVRVRQIAAARQADADIPGIIDADAEVYPAINNVW